MDDQRKPKKSTPLRWYYTRRRIRLTSMVAVPVVITLFIVTVLLLSASGSIPPLTCQISQCVPTTTPSPVLSVVLASPLLTATPIVTETRDPHYPTVTVVISPTPHPPTHCFDQQKGFKDKLIVDADVALDAQHSEQDLLLIDRDGSNACWLAYNITSFAWSRDGQYLAMSDGHHISIMSVWTQQITAYGERDGDSLPTWGADDKHIMFTSGGRIYIRNLDSQQLNFPQDVLLPGQVPADPSPDQHTIYSDPAWSPDGKRVAFVEQPDTSQAQHDVYIMNVDGSNLRRITTNGGEAPGWAADSKHLLFMQGLDFEISTGPYVQDVDNDQKPVQMGPSTVRANVKYSDLRWSPDNKYIYYSVNGQGPNQGLYVMNADGSNNQFVSIPRFFIEFAAWSPCVNGRSGPPICN